VDDIGGVAEAVDDNALHGRIPGAGYRFDPGGESTWR